MSGERKSVDLRPLKWQIWSVITELLIKLYKINKCKTTQSTDTDAFTAVGSFCFGLYVAMSK